MFYQKTDEKQIQNIIKIKQIVEKKIKNPHYAFHIFIRKWMRQKICVKAPKVMFAQAKYTVDGKFAVYNSIPPTKLELIIALTYDHQYNM